MTDKARTDADITAGAPALGPAPDIAPEDAAKYAQIRRDADAAYQAAVEKAVAAYEKALSAIPNDDYAELAWNATKADEDPLFKDVASDHQRKLKTAEESIKLTGTAGIAGLEAFEAEVVRLLAADAEAKTESKSKKAGKEK